MVTPVAPTSTRAKSLIVIVVGAAGSLELATQLGRRDPAEVFQTQLMEVYLKAHTQATRWSLGNSMWRSRAPVRPVWNSLVSRLLSAYGLDEITPANINRRVSSI